MSKLFDYIKFPHKRVIKGWLFAVGILRAKLHNVQLLTVRPTLRYSIPTEKKIDLQALLLLVAPISAFALSTWQLQLKIWRDNLISALNSCTSDTPRELPESLEEIHKLEYYPVQVSGQYLHDKEMYIGPRTLITKEESDNSSIFTTTNKTAGYLVVTPFKLANKDQVILINRGWVARNQKDPETRSRGQINGIVDVTGIVRLQETRSTFIPENKPAANVWFYRNVDQMCALTGAVPIFLDATDKSTVTDGPIGGQTRVNLDNEHLYYAIQGYSLSAVTGYMWYKQFIKQMRL